jgi:hypothetical protein
LIKRKASSFYTKIRKTKREGKEVAVVSVLAAQGADHLPPFLYAREGR